MRTHSSKKQNRTTKKNNRKLGGDFLKNLIEKGKDSANEAKGKALAELKQKGLDQIKQQALDKIQSNPAVSSLTKFLPPSVIDKIQPEQPKEPSVIVVDNKEKEEPAQPSVIVVDNKEKEEKPEQPSVIVVDNKEKEEPKSGDKKNSFLSKVSDLVKSSSETKGSTDNITIDGNDYVEGTCLFTGAKGLFPKNNTLTIKKDDLDKEVLKEELKDELKKEAIKGGKKTNKTQKKGGKKTNKRNNSKKNSKKNRSKK